MIDFGREEVKEESIGEVKEEPPKRKSPLQIIAERRAKEEAKETVKVPDFNKLKETSREAFDKPIPQIQQKVPSFIMLFNGRHGSGKTTAAELFDTPFIMDCERGKDTDAVPYSIFEKIRKLRIGTMEDIEEGNINIDIVDVQGDQTKDMWENIKKVIEWYLTKGYENHKTFVIGKGFMLRKSRGALEEFDKGRRITKFEWRPVTEDEQEIIYDLIKKCRDKKLNLINISHWGYQDSDSERSPDVKEWIEQIVTWRIDFLKPEESGYEGRYIVYLDKAPRHQYAKIDITNKNFYEIINNLEAFDKAVEEFKNIDTIEHQKGVENLLKKKG